MLVFSKIGSSFSSDCPPGFEQFSKPRISEEEVQQPKTLCGPSWALDPEDISKEEWNSLPLQPCGEYFDLLLRKSEEELLFLLHQRKKELAQCPKDEMSESDTCDCEMGDCYRSSISSATSEGEKCQVYEPAEYSEPEDYKASFQKLAEPESLSQTSDVEENVPFEEEDVFFDGHCDSCARYGHKTATCKSFMASCWNCGDRNHITRKCHLPRTGMCWSCGLVGGHKGKRCPHRNCKECGRLNPKLNPGYAHTAQDCPHKEDERLNSWRLRNALECLQTRYGARQDKPDYEAPGGDLQLPEGYAVTNGDGQGYILKHNGTRMTASDVAQLRRSLKEAFRRAKEAYLQLHPQFRPRQHAERPGPTAWQQWNPQGYASHGYAAQPQTSYVPTGQPTYYQPNFYYQSAEPYTSY